MPVPGDPLTPPHRHRRARWVIRWKAALNAFAITFGGRINPSDNKNASGQLHRKSCSPPLRGTAGRVVRVLHTRRW